MHLGEERRIQVARGRKRPRRVREPLRAEVGQSLLRHPRQRCEQLRVRVGNRRERPRNVRKLLRLEGAQVALGRSSRWQARDASLMPL